MCPARQRRDVESGLRQHARHAFNMRGLAAMRGASERQFLVAKNVTIGSARFHERQRR